MSNPVTHGWSIDVEDWFHILDYDRAPDPAAWRRQERRVHIGTECMLAALDRRGVKATFFVLGWVAEVAPDLVAEIARRGHDVGSHGHLHQLLPHLGPDEFARDLDASLQAITRATRRDVTSFRAPGFSLGPQETWALPILASRGITLDSSFFLTERAHGGFPLDRTRPFEIVLSSGHTILEVPVVPLHVGHRDFAFSGGGYLRLLPKPVLQAAFQACELRQTPAILYLHPRELDPDQPRMRLPLTRRFKYYVGLDGVADKVAMLLDRFHFGTLAQVASQTPRDLPLVLDGVA
jgi:polysaccharide deacetylase family protein (PEP-CTERM system associated)